MIATIELGHFALIMATIVATLQASLPLLPLSSPATLARRLQLICTALVFIAFGTLLHAFITSDFSVALVAQHSHSLKPMIYKISGTWGNHEGSLLLWIIILVLFGGIFASTSGALPQRFVLLTLSVQGVITLAFLSFSLFTSNPFERLEIAPLDGNGLNPVLQDVGLALHPPMLYLGYVGLSLAFSLAVAGLIEGRVDKDWGRWTRPWVLAAWSALSVGIALGSWWAYYELGWGGWWFWDPVENASLMPWLIATALMHSVLVVEKRGQLCSWTVLLAILGFSLSLVGTFIVRSGLLTSVHNFASDPSRGIFILTILLLAIGVPLLLFAWRGPQLSQPSDAALLSRDTALIINNMILVVATAIVLIATFYPLGLELVSGMRITVGPPYFDATFTPVMALAAIGMVVGPVLVWRRGIMPKSRSVLLAAGGGALFALIMALILPTMRISAAGLAGCGLLGWLGIGILADMQRQLKFHKPSAIGGRLYRLGLPIWGVWLGHSGAAIFLAGVLGSSLASSEAIVRVLPGAVIELADRQYRFESVEQNLGPNYQAQTAHLSLETKDGRVLAKMKPEKRFYPIEQQATTEAAIRATLLGDDYAVLGDGDDTLGYILRLYHKPLISWIWGGAGVMAFGGLMALAGRRRPKTRKTDPSGPVSGGAP